MKTTPFKTKISVFQNACASIRTTEEKYVALRRPTLDDVFLTLTGHGAEVEAEQVETDEDEDETEKASVTA